MILMLMLMHMRIMIMMTMGMMTRPVRESPSFNLTPPSCNTYLIEIILIIMMK